MNKLAIIDADGLCYMSSRETLEESIQALDDKIQNIFDKTGCTHYVFFISKGRYFRHNLSNDYKLGRAKYPTKLKWLKTLKNYLIEKWNAQSMDLVEADDLCAYWMNTKIYEKIETGIDIIDNSFLAESIYDKVLCAVDKDLLLSIPSNGKGHFNYTYKLEVKDDPSSIIKGWWVETDINESSFFVWNQMVIGDNSDSVIGLYKKGESWCNKNLVGSLRDVQHIVFEEYLKEHGVEKGIYEFQKNYRLLHMLDCDEDFIREISQVPQFPTISAVQKQIVEPIIEF